MSENDLSHNMFDILVFLMILCASTEKIWISVYKQHCFVQELPRCDESEMRFQLPSYLLCTNFPTLSGILGVWEGLLKQAYGIVNRTSPI